MADQTLTDAKIFGYSFEVPIDRPADTVWGLISTQINDWWMTDFRVLGSDSTVSLQAEAGGALVERSDAGEALEWYRVQMCVPGRSLYLVGYMAPEWGGPTISMLRLTLEPNGSACILKVSDSLLGNTSEKAAGSAEDGWRLMFGDGLRKYAETG